MLQLDDWVLCRIYNKKGTLEKHFDLDQSEVEFSDSEEIELKPKVEPFLYNNMMTPEPVVQTTNFFAPQNMNDYLQFDASDSVPTLHTDSSSSGQSPEFTSDHKEVQSVTKLNEFDNSLDFQLHFFDGLQDEPFISQMQYNDQNLMFQDMFAFAKPF